MDKMDAQPHFRTTRIDDYYVDQDKLYALLKNQFGSAFEVKWRLNEWIIKAPTRLSDPQINELRI